MPFTYNIRVMFVRIIITHSDRALFNLNARVEARGTIVPKAAGRGYYGPERLCYYYNIMIFDVKILREHTLVI